MKRILVMLIVIAGLLSCVQANCYSVGNSVEAMYEEGIKFFEKEDYDRAFARFQISGEVKGYAPGQNMLGVCYRDGLGTEQDIAEAEKCFRLSAEQGYAPAKENLTALVGEQKSEKEKTAKESNSATISEGDYVTFGSYEQDNNLTNGPEPIEWLVLDVQEGKALLISKLGLDCQPYNSIRMGIPWEDCSLRTWMNNTFFNTAFLAGEQEQIVATYVIPEKPRSSSRDLGNNTWDKVFLLSIQEVCDYFTKAEMPCQPTEFAKAAGCYVSPDDGNCWWWLRSSGPGADDAGGVLPDGVIRFNYVSLSNGAVRPALWIKLNEEKDYSKMANEAESWEDVPVTVENFSYFYDVELVDNNFEISPDGNSIIPQLALSYRLKPEFADKAVQEDSYVEVKVRGDYEFRGITSIDWKTGEIGFLETPSAEMIVNLQHIALANGSASLADKFSRRLSETAGGVVEIPIPLNRLADGVFIFHSGIRGPVSPLMKSDFVSNGTFLAQLNDLRIVSAHGKLRLKEFSGHIEGDAFSHTVSDDSEAEGDETEYLEYLPLKDGKAGITRYARSGEKISVPDTMEGYTISEIGDYAFAYRDTLKEIILPDGVTTIGYQAFYGCCSLERIVLPSTIISIGDSVFDECNINMLATVSRGSYAEKYCKEHDLLYQYEDGTSPDEDVLDEDDFVYRLLEDGTAEIMQYTGTIKRLSVPDMIDGYKVTSVGESAFEKSDIITVILPDSIVSIGKDAFTLSSLVAIKLPDRLQSIGRSAFNSCTSLTSITIPSGVTRISGYTFYFCTHLTDVVIPDSVTTIEKNAFGICNKLKTITIPSSVTSIEDEAFPNNGLSFIVDNGSYAEQYCKEHGIQFCYRDDN